MNVADTEANRKAFGCSGTANQDGDGAAPFPQARMVALTARAGRAALGAVRDRGGPRPGTGRRADAKCDRIAPGQGRMEG